MMCLALVSAISNSRRPLSDAKEMAQRRHYLEQGVRRVEDFINAARRHLRRVHPVEGPSSFEGISADCYVAILLRLASQHRNALDCLFPDGNFDPGQPFSLPSPSFDSRGLEIRLENEIDRASDFAAETMQSPAAAPSPPPQSTKIWTVEDYYRVKRLYEENGAVFMPALERGSPAAYHVMMQAHYRASGLQTDNPQPKLKTAKPDSPPKRKRKAGAVGLHRNTLELFKAALRKWHNYDSPDKFNPQPATTRKIEELTEKRISDTTVLRCFGQLFGGMKAYRVCCVNKSIESRLRALMGDLSFAIDPQDLDASDADDDERD